MRKKADRSPRQHIFKLKEKMWFLWTNKTAQERVEQRTAGRVTSINATHEATGIPLNSLQDALREEDQEKGIAAGDEKLGRRHQELLAQFFGFDISWREWIDPGADDLMRPSARKDRVDEFKNRYFTEHAGQRDTNLPLMQGPERDIEDCVIRGLASVELICGNTGIGETVIGAIVTCGEARVEVSPYPIALREADLEIDCAKARAADDTIKGKEKSAGGYFTATGTHGEVTCTWIGNRQKLRWRLVADGSSVGSLTFDRDLARIEHLAPGDVLTGTLSACIKDIMSDAKSPPRPVDTIALVNRGKPVDMPAEELTELQLRVMEHLRKKVLDIADDGYAVLTRHELHVIRRP